MARLFALNPGRAPRPRTLPDPPRKVAGPTRPGPARIGRETPPMSTTPDRPLTPGCYRSRRSAIGRSAAGYCPNCQWACRSFDPVQREGRRVALATPRERAGPDSDWLSPKRLMATAELRGASSRRRRAPLPGGQGKRGAAIARTTTGAGLRPLGGIGAEAASHGCRCTNSREVRAARATPPAVRQRRPVAPQRRGRWRTAELSRCAYRRPPSRATQTRFGRATLRLGSGSGLRAAPMLRDREPRT
jgi:hypothetical protein